MVASKLRTCLSVRQSASTNNWSCNNILHINIINSWYIRMSKNDAIIYYCSYYNIMPVSTTKGQSHSHTQTICKHPNKRNWSMKQLITESCDNSEYWTMQWPRLLHCVIGTGSVGKQSDCKDQIDMVRWETNKYRTDSVKSVHKVLYCTCLVFFSSIQQLNLSDPQFYYPKTYFLNDFTITLYHTEKVRPLKAPNNAWLHF